VPLTPADIHNAEFGKASLGKRGYDEDQVDALLDEVTREMIRLLEENDVLQRRLHQVDAVPAAQSAAAHNAAQAELSAAAADLDRSLRACEQAEVNARHMRRQLDEARRSADANARANAAAGESTGPVLMMAQRTADDHLHRAHEESRALLADARERCGRMTDEARKLAGDIEQNARRQQSDATAAIESTRAGLLREIDELTEFVESYRAALESHLLRQEQLLAGTADSPIEPS